MRGPPPPPAPTTTILWSKYFFSLLKSENIKFFHVNNMWDFSLFVEQDITDKNLFLNLLF